jgi:hypothetical protein
MTTKLTLSIESSVIEQAKNYARSHNKSLSRLIENYLKSLVLERENTLEEPSMLYNLKGSFVASIESTDDEILQKALKEKYLK